MHARVVVALAVLLGGVGAVPSLAQQAPVDQSQTVQTQASRPYRGLFGAGTQAAPGGTALDLTAEAYEEYGNTQEGATVGGPLVLGTGWFTGLHGGLALQSNGRWTRVGLRGEGSLRYYRSVQQTTLPRFRADLGVDSSLGKRHTDNLRLNLSAEYEPYYVLSVFQAPVNVTDGTAIVPVSRDDLIYRHQRYIFGEGFEYEHQISTRTYLRFIQGARYTMSTGNELDVHGVSVSARLGHRMSRYASINVGYGYEVGNYGLQTLQKIETQNVDLGIEYRRPLTRSRRTTFGFTTGAALLSAQPHRQWQALGTANLRHEFNRGWFIQGDFGRSVQLVEGFTAPFLVNTVTASVGGFMGRRVELVSSGGYSSGVVGFGSDRYHAVQGSARLRLALARYVAIDTEGLTNQYLFNNRIAVPTSLPPQLNRWAVRCSVALWLPLAR